MIECLHQTHSLPFIIPHFLKPTKNCFPLLEKALKSISLLQKEKYMNSLFDSFERTCLEFAKHNYNTYEYYNNSARTDMSKVRDTLERWFHNYPEEEKKELKNRFKKDFDSSFYELFLHELFCKLGYDITIHPDLPSSPKKPDFLISKDNLELYIEAKVVKGKTMEQEAFERKRNELYDNLNKLNTKDFFLNIEDVCFLTQKQPGTKEMIKCIEEELKKIDPDILREELEKNGIQNLPKIEYKNRDVHIIVSPIPVSPSTREEKIRPIGIYPAEAFWGGGEESLKESIEKKAKRYGKLDKPFIVCLNSLDIRTSGKIDVDNAIWGTVAFSWSTNPESKDEKWIRQLDGVFCDKKGVRLKNLTGVFVSKVCPHNIPVANYWLYEHPFSENKMDFDKIGLKFNYISEGKIIDNTGDNIGDILEIPKDWLT